jgi:hypothetical protein
VGLYMAWCLVKDRDSFTVLSGVICSSFIVASYSCLRIVSEGEVAEGIEVCGYGPDEGIPDRCW